jgi:hypothetical protein
MDCLFKAFNTHHKVMGIAFFIFISLQEQVLDASSNKKAPTTEL